MGDKIRKSPNIRFVGFTDVWEQREFGEIINERREKTKVENEDTLLSCAIDGIYLNSELFSHFRGTSNIGYLKVRKNDMILSAQNLHLGNCNINKRFEHGIISPAYKVYSLVGVDSDFMHAWIKKDTTKQFFEKASTEGASVCRKNIEWGTLYNQKMYIPSYDEQQKIGSLFNELDKAITLHQRKLELLKVTKKSMLQKMFPKDGGSIPEIRFAGFTGDWEQRELNKYIETSKVKNSDDKYTKNDVLSVSGEVGVVNQIEFQGRSFAGVSVRNYGVVDTGNIVYTKSPLKLNPHGIIKTNKGKAGIVSTLYAVYKAKENTNPNFVHYYFEYDYRLNKYLKPLVNKGAKNDMKVSDNNALLGLVMFPSYDEQAKISEFFESLDNLITTQQSELDLLKNLKKSMLQQMFI